MQDCETEAKGRDRLIRGQTFGLEVNLRGVEALPSLLLVPMA